MQDVEDEPLFCERVAGLDIAKAGVEVTFRVPSDTTGAAASRKPAASAPPPPSWSRWATGWPAGA
jgi:hypothetical protein